MGSPLLAAIDFSPFVAWWKAVPFLLLLFFWCRILTWIDKDTKKVNLARQGINAGMIFAFVLGILAFFFLPGFGLAIGLMVGLLVVSLGGYIGFRSSKVGLEDLRDSIAEEFGSIFKLGKGKSEKEELATGDFIFTPKTGTNIRQPDAEDPNYQGYVALCHMLLDPMIKGAQTVELSASGEMASTRFLVDGVPYEGIKLEKAQAAEAVALVKRIANLDVDEKRKPQSGKFKMGFAGTKHEAHAKVQGSSAGESMRLEFDVTARYQFKSHELGFTADQLQYFEDTLNEPGIVLLAMPKGTGLTTLEYAMLRNHDAFTSHILTIERDPPIELEGITQNKLGAGASPAEEAKTVSWVTSQEPSVLMVSSIETPEAANDLIRYAANGRRAYVGVKAGDVFEALEQWRKLVGDTNKAMSQLSYVVAGRVFRRLCDATKIPYQPDEKLLRQLGMHPGKVTELYKPSFGNLRDARGNEVPDTFCHGLGYKGRFGVYELFVIDDEVRSALNQGLTGQSIRTFFRKQKRRYIQELALARLEAGDTDVKEFLRILKPGSSDSSSKPATRV
jgi:type II secretory ATPase GspE/PulE/Tfp pilus assembly ATPase PilB-like protein